MENIKLGSVESLIVPLRDRLNNVEDLNLVSNLRYDVKKKSDDSDIVSNVNAGVDSGEPMRALCEIDTTLSAFDATEDIEYKLYIKYTSGTEAPILGPVFFRVVVD